MRYFYILILSILPFFGYAQSTYRVGAPTSTGITTAYNLRPDLSFAPPQYSDTTAAAGVRFMGSMIRTSNGIYSYSTRWNKIDNPSASIDTSLLVVQDTSRGQKGNFRLETIPWFKAGLTIGNLYPPANAYEHSSIALLIRSDTTNPLFTAARTGIANSHRLAYTTTPPSNAIYTGLLNNINIGSANTSTYPTPSLHPAFIATQSAITAQAGATGTLPMATASYATFNTNGVTVIDARGYEMTWDGSGTYNYVTNFRSITDAGTNRIAYYSGLSDLENPVHGGGFPSGLWDYYGNTGYLSYFKGGITSPASVTAATFKMTAGTPSVTSSDSVMVKSSDGTLKTYLPVSAIGGGGGSGSVSSVGVASPSGTITVSGTNPVTGSGTINVDLANSGVVAGTYNNVMVNARGIVTSGSNVAYLQSEVDGSTTNEIQDLSLTGQSLGISGGGTGVSLVPGSVGLGNVPNVDATNPANIVQTSSYRFTTDAEKATWNGKQNAIGYTPENAANKSIDTALGTSNTTYSSTGAVKDYVDRRVVKLLNTDATQNTAINNNTTAIAGKESIDTVITTVAISSGVLTLNLANKTKATFRVNVDQNIASVVLQNPTTTGYYRIIFVQDATGGRTLASTSWASNVYFQGGIKPVLQTTANGRDNVILEYDGTVYDADYGYNYRP
jgi:hypothetical protein